MNTYREMILLSVDEFNRIRKQLLFQQPSNEQPTLQKELYDLKDKVQNLPADQRIKLEGEVIARHTDHMRPQMGDEVVTIQKQPTDTTFISQHLDMFAKNNKKRSQQMLHHLASFRPQWNELGQLLTQDGEPIPKSNIVELIDAVTSTRRTTRIPAGFSDFIQLLEASSIPRHLFSTFGMSKVENYKQADSDSSDSSIIPQNWINLTR